MENDIDSGRGLMRCGRWLVSSARGHRIRWLAPWLQCVIAEGWNLALVAHDQTRPYVSWRRAAYGAVAAYGAAFLAIAPRLPAWPS